jgi:LmbE family N-acetylglucosaminyl deacetylase
MGLKVLVLEAHVDDADCGCAATIYRHIKNGDEVFWHTLVSRGYKTPYNWPANTLKIEWLESLRRLGITNYHIYDYRVDTLDNTMGVRDRVFRIWNDLNPDVAYVPWRNSRHQDHRATGDFAYQVSWRSHADILAYPVINDRAGFTPNVFSMVDDEALTAKLEAISKFKSQFELRSWFSMDVIEAAMKSDSVFVNGTIRYVETFEQIKRVLR